MYVCVHAERYDEYSARSPNGRDREVVSFFVVVLPDIILVFFFDEIFSISLSFLDSEIFKLVFSYQVSSTERHLLVRLFK